MAATVRTLGMFWNSEAAWRPNTGWESDNSSISDAVAAYAALCWRGRDPLEDAATEFERLATTFWRPAMSAMRGASEVGE